MEKDKEMKPEDLRAALQDYFGENLNTGRFLDTNKIKFICKDIENLSKGQEKMNDNIEKIHEKLDNKYVSQERFWPVQALVFGCTALLLTGVVVALVASILK